MRDVYLHPTVKKLAVVIRENSQKDKSNREVPEVHKASNFAYYSCWIAQTLTYIAFICLNSYLLIESIKWIVTPNYWGYLLTFVYCDGRIYNWI